MPVLKKFVAIRRLTEQQGLDPNRWFGNVELTAAKTLGRKPVDFVIGSYKYYVSYRLHLESIRLTPKRSGGHPRLSLTAN